MTHATQPSSTRALVVLLLSLFVLAAVLGVLAHQRYVRAERYLRAVFARAAVEGQQRDVEDCVGWVLQQARTCEAAQPMCEAAIPGLVERCLAAQDRGAFCGELRQHGGGDSHWSFNRCSQRGYSRRHHACASAYLAVDAVCWREASST